MKKIKHGGHPEVRPVPKEEVCEMCGLPWEWHKYATKDECIRLLRYGKRVVKVKSSGSLMMTGCTILGGGITSTGGGWKFGNTGFNTPQGPPGFAGYTSTGTGTSTGLPYTHTM